MKTDLCVSILYTSSNGLRGKGSSYELKIETKRERDKERGKKREW